VRSLAFATCLSIFGLGVLAADLSSTTPSTQLQWRLSVISDAANALDAAAKAIATLGDSIAHLVGLGDHTWQTVSARNTRKRLIDLSARASTLVTVKNGALVSSLEKYINDTKPTAKEWSDVTKGIQDVITDATDLLRDLEAERSDFVLQEAYQDLKAALGARVSILTELGNLPPPTSEAERKALKQVDANYKKVVANTKVAISEMNKYLQSAAPHESAG
jgi:hypothetical protein